MSFTHKIVGKIIGDKKSKNRQQIIKNKNYIECSLCKGTGEQDGFPPLRCPKCEGEGVWEK